MLLDFRDRTEELFTLPSDSWEVLVALSRAFVRVVAEMRSLNHDLWQVHATAAVRARTCVSALASRIFGCHDLSGEEVFSVVQLPVASGARRVAAHLPVGSVRGQKPKNPKDRVAKLPQGRKRYDEGFSRGFPVFDGRAGQRRRIDPGHAAQVLGARCMQSVAAARRFAVLMKRYIACWTSRGL